MVTSAFGNVQVARYLRQLGIGCNGPLSREIGQEITKRIRKETG
jgi:hypothetical protein